MDRGPEKKEDVDFDEIEILKEKYKGRYITLYSPEYPHELRQTTRPPFVLFYKGDKNLLKKENRVWTFGSYIDDETSEFITGHAKELNNEGITIVSGLNSEFENSFIENIKPKQTIFIKSSGIDSYIEMSKTSENILAEDNLILSEYPDLVIPSLYTWEMSNRIKAGISSKLYLINSLKNKITFKLISETIDEKRDIYCYARDITPKSHNSVLINKGAYGIISVKELKK